jgi:hypothetical protein
LSSGSWSKENFIGGGGLVDINDSTVETGPFSLNALYAPALLDASQLELALNHLGLTSFQSIAR